MNLTNEAYNFIITILCTVTATSLCFAVIPWLLLLQAMRRYERMFLILAELTQDIKSTTQHVSVAVSGFTELVNSSKKNA